MKKSEKILATIGIIIGCLVILVILQTISNAVGGGSVGALAGMIILGVIYGIRSIWKSKPNSPDNSSNLPDI